MSELRFVDRGAVRGGVATGLAMEVDNLRLGVEVVAVAPVTLGVDDRLGVRERTGVCFTGVCNLLDISRDDKLTIQAIPKALKKNLIAGLGAPWSG